MPRTKFRPHGEAHHMEGGGDRWTLDLFDWDPIRGLVLVVSLVGLTFAATIATREFYNRVLGDGTLVGGEQP